MNFGTAKTLVQQYIDWSGPNAESMVENWINLTRRELAVALKFDFLLTVHSYPATGTNLYTFPSDYIDHLYIFVGDSLAYEKRYGYGVLFFRVPNPLGGPDLVAASPPGGVDSAYQVVIQGRNFFFIGDTLPVEGQDTITLWYYAFPQNLVNDTDEDTMMIMFGELVCWGAALRGAVYLDDELKVKMFSSLYQEGLKGALAGIKKIPIGKEFNQQEYR